VVGPDTGRLSAGMVKVLFFAKLREDLQCAELHVKIGDSVSLRALKERIGEQLKGADEQICHRDVLCAVNQNIVSAESDVHVSNGDEVAFFPPVTGG